MQRVILFTSAGGGGHLSASNALATYLKDDYEVTQVCLLADILKSFDPILLATLGKCGGEATYNAITPYNQWWLLNLIYRLGRIYFVPFEPFMRKRIVQYLKENNADMVISVIPIFNNYITYDGFPLRSEFFEKKDPAALRASMGIEPNIPVVMIMMGSLGANNLVECVKHLKDLPDRMHLLVCIGKHQTIKGPLEAIQLPCWITMDIVEETNRISDYMAVSNLLITKSGTASFCEAIHMHLPMVIDATSSTLIWERFNHKFTLDKGLGMVIKNYEQLPQFVAEFFKNPAMSREIKHNLSLIRLKDTPEKVRSRVARMLRPSYQYGNLVMAYGKKSRFD